VPDPGPTPSPVPVVAVATNTGKGKGKGKTPQPPAPVAPSPGVAVVSNVSMQHWPSLGGLAIQPAGATADGADPQEPPIKELKPAQRAKVIAATEGTLLVAEQSIRNLRSATTVRTVQEKLVTGLIDKLGAFLKYDKIVPDLVLNAFAIYLLCI